MDGAGEDNRMDRFNVLGSHGKVTIPWMVIAPHAAQAYKNHLQSLERLNERGGLDWAEMLAVLEDRQWERMDPKEAMPKVLDIVAKTVCTVKMVEYEGHYVPEECCSMTNPATTQGGKSEADDCDTPCGCNCGGDCENCVIQKIMDQYAVASGQAVK